MHITVKLERICSIYRAYPCSQLMQACWDAIYKPRSEVIFMSLRTAPWSFISQAFNIRSFWALRTSDYLHFMFSIRYNYLVFRLRYLAGLYTFCCYWMLAFTVYSAATKHLTFYVPECSFDWVSPRAKYLLCGFSSQQDFQTFGKILTL